MKDNIIVTKSFVFAVRIVKLCKKLVSENREYVLSQQLLKSGTSIGANVEEAVGGITKREFTAKLQIAYKEARETRYWLRLMAETDILEKAEADSLLTDCEELIRIIVAILKSSKN